MSLDESFIVLGLEGGAKDDDSAVIVAYNELVRSLSSFLILDWCST